MSPLKRRWNGARWWKIDLHSHTPASDDYGRGPQREVLRARSPEEWLLDYMRAEIDCVAVTDHNSGTWVDRLKTALAQLNTNQPEGYRPLHLFPGVEISVNGGVHVLAILGADKTTSDIDTLLGSVSFSGTKGSSDSVTSKSFQEVIAAITVAGGIAIPAHADGESGLLQLTGATLIQALRSEDIVAIEIVDTSTPKPGAYEQKSVRWVEVVGSDAHHPSGQPSQRYPGSHFTWVKMGAPSLDGLRLALRDGPLSIRRSDSESGDPNQHAPLVLQSIEVAAARYMGRPSPFVLELNPWLNAIVGGRGTGKSSTVEFLRLALGRQRELPEEFSEEFLKYVTPYEDRVDSGLLTSDASIAVTYLKDGARFRVEHKPLNGESASIQEQVGDQWRPAEGDVAQRFPVRIYSQKQIFQLAKTPLALLRIVDDSAQVDRLAWQERWTHLTSQYLSQKAQLRQLSIPVAEESRLRGELDDVTRKLTLFEASEHANVLSEFQRYSRQQRTLDTWKESWSATGDRLRELAAEIVPEVIQISGEGSEEVQLRAESEKIRERLSSIRESLEALASEADLVSVGWNTAMTSSSWKTRADAAQNAYRTLVGQLKEMGVADSEAYAEQAKRRQEIEDRLAALEERRAQIRALEAEAAATLSELAMHRRNLTDSRRRFLEGVLNGNRYVQIHVDPYGAKDAADAEFRKLLQREQGGFERDIGSSGGEGLLGRLYSGGKQTEEVEGRLAEVKQRVRDIAAATHDVKGLSDQRFAKHVQNLAPEVLDRLDFWFPEDSLEVSYSPKGDRTKFRPIAEGSPGQKTAALLAFLLSYGDEPLVLDQPEDDLDNHLIYDLIVTQLREVKRRRQVIVVTHNSNIVVNGDAELVFALAVRGGQTQKECEGCLQESAVRESICNVMEGGREAFEQRYRRIALGSEQA
jgi:hypothetical protein